MPHPLHEYRRVQLEVRREFEPFTRKYCPSCPAPCCRKPARITPTDILLAEAHGWKARVSSVVEKDAVDRTATDLSACLENDPDLLSQEPCEHLGAQGCTFP